MHLASAMIAINTPIQSLIFIILIPIGIGNLPSNPFGFNPLIPFDPAQFTGDFSNAVNRIAFRIALPGFAVNSRLDNLFEFTE
jgi:hypothetical protein